MEHSFDRGMFPWAKRVSRMSHYPSKTPSVLSLLPALLHSILPQSSVYLSFIQRHSGLFCFPLISHTSPLLFHFPYYHTLPSSCPLPTLSLFPLHVLPKDSLRLVGLFGENRVSYQGSLFNQLPCPRSIKKLVCVTQNIWAVCFLLLTPPPHTLTAGSAGLLRCALSPDKENSGKSWLE